MRFKLLSIFAAAVLVAACESTPETSDSDAGTGEVIVDVVEVEEINPRSSQYITEVLGDRVFFDFDSSVINAQAQQTVKRWAEWMNTFGDVVVIVEGHADERGTREYNLALGERRANAIKNFMVAMGVDPSRIATISFGKERPAVEGHTEAAWAQNRRGVLVLG
jgi:peptidoglycan-associated lipoprotein